MTMTRPSDYVEQLCQRLTDDALEVRQHLENIEGQEADKARSVVERILERVTNFDLSFGSDREGDG